jgi:Fur family ferric uptake transcriptional regulator
MQDNSEILVKLKELIKKKGLKYTKQREIIFEIILNSKEHLSAEELYNIIVKRYPDTKVGMATIYRTLLFLEESSLISSISLDKDSRKFETNFKAHHDHLICAECNKIVEFVNDKIEKEQELIAKKHGFRLLNHTMYLYGVCEDCQK